MPKLRKLEGKEKEIAANREAVLNRALSQPQTRRDTMATRLSQEEIKTGAAAIKKAVQDAGPSGISTHEARLTAEKAVGRQDIETSSYGSMLWQGGAAKKEDGRYYGRGVRGPSANGTKPETKAQPHKGHGPVSDKPIELDGNLTVHVTDEEGGVDMKVKAGRVSIWRRR